MKNIHGKIQEELHKFKVSTGHRPENIYLGEAERCALMRWAHENGYIDNPHTANIEGDSRPEIEGLFVYVVNAPTHLACS